MLKLSTIYVHLYSLSDNSTQFILAGDYNLPNVKFLNNDLGMIYSGVHTPSADIIFEHFSSLNLYQINMIENEFGNSLDLIFVTKNSTRANKSEDFVVPLDKYHSALNIYSDISINPKQSIDTEKKCNFKKANYVLLSNLLNNLNWSYLYECIDINLAMDRFYELIFQAAPKVFPRKSSFPHWFSKELISLIHKKINYIKNLNKVAYHIFITNFQKQELYVKLLQKVLTQII